MHFGCSSEIEMESWHPDRSCVPSLDDPGGRGCDQEATEATVASKKKIVRRKHPTVDPRIRDTIAEAVEDPVPTGTFDPISDTKADDCCGERLARPAPTSGFCGWQEREALSRYACEPKHSHLPAHCAEVSARGSRQAGSKLCQPFRHLLPDSSAHMEAYRPFGYTSICAGKAAQPPATAKSVSEEQNAAEDKKDLHQERVQMAAGKEQVQDAIRLDHRPDKEGGTKCSTLTDDRERRTRSYLHELALRLGVKESLRSFCLKAAIRPSPPSVTKNRQIDFILYGGGPHPLGAAKDSASNGSSGTTTVTDEEEDSEEHKSSDCRLGGVELPPIATKPPPNNSNNLCDSTARDPADIRCMEHAQAQPPTREALGTPRRAESTHPSREAVLLRTAQSLGIASRAWSSRRRHDRSPDTPEHDSPVHAGNTSSGKGSAYDENKLSLSDDSNGHATRQNSSVTHRNNASGPSEPSSSSQERRRRDDSAPPTASRKPPHCGASQLTAVMRPQKLSRTRRKLSAALSGAGAVQERPLPPPPPQISGILGIHRHPLVSP